jgi:hypothetical protein
MIEKFIETSVPAGKKEEKKFDLSTFDSSLYQRIEDMPQEARGYFMPVSENEGGGFRPNSRFEADLRDIKDEKRARYKEFDLHYKTIDLFADKRVKSKAKEIVDYIKHYKQDMIKLLVDAKKIKNPYADSTPYGRDNRTFSLKRPSRPYPNIVFDFDGKTWNCAIGNFGPEFFPQWAGSPLSSMSDHEIKYKLDLYEKLSEELKSPGKPSYELSVEMGIKDESYQPGGYERNVASYSGTVMIEKGGETWKAEGFGPTGNAHSVHSEGGIKFTKISGV